MLQAERATTSKIKLFRKIKLFSQWADWSEELNWSIDIGSKTLEASLAAKNMQFKSLNLITNAKRVHIKQKPFLSALVANLNMII